MKIGVVIYGSIETVSGGTLYDRILADYLRAHGDEVRIIALSPGAYLTHFLDNLTFRLPDALDCIIEDELVHPSLLAANHRRRKPGPRLISLVHNLHSSERRARWQNANYRQVERLHLGSVDGWIFNSAATRDSVHDLLGPAKPHVLAPPGGDRLGSLTSAQVAERLQRNGPLRLVSVANVTALKGLGVVLDALRDLPPGWCTLDVAGSLAADPPFAARMQRRAAALQQPVTFHGLLGAAELAALLSTSDIMVIPSFWEGFGIAYLEGMAHGLPAIGTTAGAIPQMITAGENGFLISPGDSTALAALIRQLDSDRALLQRVSVGALRYFASQPTWMNTGSVIRQFLVEQLSRPQLA